MMTAAGVFRWDEATGRLVPVAADSDEVLLAADSWLVSEGRVRGLDLHWERFFIACADVCGIERSRIEAFCRAVTAALPREGRWFPRVELVRPDAAFELRFRLRPAPLAGQSIRMMRWSGEDARVFPRRKGPDLALLGRMRQQTIDQGADEALLTASDGTVLEGLTTNVMWWEGAELCLPRHDLPILAGVTCRLMVRMAHAMQIPVRYKHAHIDELRQRTVWTVNALHGLRPVIRWMDGGEARGDVDHQPWQAHLLDLGVHLDAGADMAAAHQ